MTAVGFEPTANRLKGDCSTPELRGQATRATTEQHGLNLVYHSLSREILECSGKKPVSQVYQCISVSGVSGVSDKFESMWLTVSRVSGVSGVSGVSAGAVNYSTVDCLLRRNWRA